MGDRIKPIALPGIHQKFFVYLSPVLKAIDNPYILDIGAGHGALTKKLFDEGYHVAACDLFPENFHFDKIDCQKSDITKHLPYPDSMFDVLLAVEVMEHIHDHENFLKESNRILKKDGLLLFSTPNILSLKSRFRFLLSGFYYAFGPLDHSRHDGLQHVASITIDQYQNLAVRSGFKTIDIAIDKRQNSSRALSFMVPFIKLYCCLKPLDYKIHNQFNYLTGRILFVKLQKM